MLIGQAAKTAEKVWVCGGTFQAYLELSTETMDEIRDGPRVCDAGHNM